MIEVYVSQEHGINVGNVEIVLRQRVEQQRHGTVRAGIDEGRATVLDDQMAGIVMRPRVLGIDRDDAGAGRRRPRTRLGRHSLSVVSRPSSEA